MANLMSFPFSFLFSLFLFFFYVWMVLDCIYVCGLCYLFICLFVFPLFFGLYLTFSFLFLFCFFARVYIEKASSFFV